MATQDAAAATCTGGALGAVLGVSPTTAHVGDTITVTTLGVSLGSPVCNVTNGQSFIVYPSGAASRALYQTNFVLTSPQSENCIGLGAPAPDGSCRAVANTYVIQAADVGRDLSWSTPRGHGFSLPGQAGFIQFDAGSDAFTVPTGAGQTAQLEGGDAPQSVVIVTPRISVTKNCVNTCTPYGQPIQFSGTVCNTGDDALAGVNVSDNPAATITFSTTTSFGTNSFPAGGGGLLRPGECVNYTGIYMPSGNLCGPFTDTIIASGTDFSDDPAFIPKTVSATNSATCHVSKNPGLLLSKNCFNSTNAASHVLNIGSSWVDVFTVTNTGNVPLTNVVITDVDSKLGTITIVIGSLPIGGSATRAFTNGPTTQADCGTTISDSATVRGVSVCPLDATCPGPTSVTNGPVTCTLTVVPCAPHVSILKGVACAPASGIAGCDGSLTYRKNAQGVAGTNNPAFCYQIIVINDGQQVLTNVGVVDTLLGALSGFPTTLAIGERKTNYTSMSWGVGNHTNTAVVTGFGAQSGTQVSATNGANAVVVPASVSCSLTLSSSLNLNTNGSGACQVTLPSPLPNNASNTPVGVSITVNNTGQADLNVRIIDGTVLSLVDCANDVTPLNLGSLVVRVPAGGSFTTNGCVLVSCPGTTITATVQGTAVASTNFPCIYDSLGNAIKTAPSSCQQCVNCTEAVVCRVTGGGVLNPTNVDQSCILMVTTLSPAFSQVGTNGPQLALTEITHGGQLGAPFSQRDCGEVLGNPCIRGQWEHVRHYQGKGNPRDVVTAFHSVTPKGQFDTLNCACLGCCDPASGAFIPPVTGPLIKKFALCNPDDHRICGPQPRPAPANAIIFTGVGRLTPTTDSGTDNKNSQWVVFRVYIEDRSEPGGNHPKGAIDPADVYCFQAWYTGIPVTKKPDFSTVAPAFRQALGGDSCAFLEALNSGALPIGSLPNTTVGGVAADIVDQGPLYDGNHQIHPATGATCP